MFNNATVVIPNLNLNTNYTGKCSFSGLSVQTHYNLFEIVFNSSLVKVVIDNLTLLTEAMTTSLMIL